MANWKKLLILMIVILAAGLTATSIIFGGIPLGKPTRVDTSFATTALVRCHYNDKSIDRVVTNANDVKALKRLLAGYAWGNGLPEWYAACMFGTEASITLSGGEKSITFCPAFCDDPLVEIDSTGKYLHMSGARRKALDHICRKYGLRFPL